MRASPTSRRRVLQAASALDYRPDARARMLRSSRSRLLGVVFDVRPTSDQSYPNFIDGAETNYLRAYYGTNLERLVDVKRKYDPNNLFRFSQGIPLSL